MSTIRSILIQTCMANVQKEIGHLEHWLTHLPAEGTAPAPTVTAPAVTPANIDILSLTSVVNRLSEQLTAQQHTLHHLMDRITILENLRQVHIDELSQKSDNPWLDNQCVPLTNEIIGEECCLSEEPLYTFYKETSQAQSPSSTPSIVPDVPDSASDVPDIVSEHEDHDVVPYVEPAVPAAPPTSPTPAAPVTADVHVTAELSAFIQEAEEKKEEAVEAETEVEEEVEEEVEVEEEEEEGVELEEIEYKQTKYYRDGEGFIYTIDEDEQPSENPVGYWKEKTQTIAFYKTK